MYAEFIMMNRVLSKILYESKGIDNNEWKTYLQASHSRYPQMTPEFFGRYLTENGKSSYQVLADKVEKTDSQSKLEIVDLGCGDGFLFHFLLDKIGASGKIYGVDISEVELSYAAKIEDKRILLFNQSCDKLPVADASIDYVLCHLSLMLFTPVETCIAEIMRVLKPGGKLCSVVIDHEN